MLSVYVPVVSTGTNSNPRACIGDSIYEWVVNNTTVNTLTRIRKDTYYLDKTINLPDTGCTHIALGTYSNNNYIFTSSGTSSGNIYRINSYPTTDNVGDTLRTITLTKTDTGKNVSCSAIYYRNGYLWLVPSDLSNIFGTIIRLNIFDSENKLSYSYTESFTEDQVTVYTDVDSITNTDFVSTMYIFGNYVFTLSNNNSSRTVITKMSTLIPGTKGIISSITYTSTITYYNMNINSIASDNISYIWMSRNSNSFGNIYRMPLDYNSIINEPTPTIQVTSFESTLKSVSAMKYGAGYLWITGIRILNSLPSLVQVDVTTNNIITTIPLITSSTYTGAINSSITSIDIYNEYMWLTDITNSALLKMKIYIPCFMEGTKILCLNSQMKEEYIPIENIRKGHLVKTSLNGFVPVCMIGHSIISNPGTNDRIKNRLYKCSKNKYPELFEDLYITGCHSILVDELSDLLREKTMDALGDVFITDRKYRLMAYLDDRSEPYTETGVYTIWHFALENNDYLMNYGIYANGLLVESTSKRYMKELSGMKLIE